MKIRIKFQKYGVMKFVGHLDIMRYFQKAIRRADIDIAYSGGFCPHQIMSFASPLGVGATSDGEYLDIEVNSTSSSNESIKALNNAGVEGITVCSYRRLPDNAKTAMSMVAAADYIIGLCAASQSCLPNDWKHKITEFYAQTSIPILKKTKKSEKELDLKSLIYELSADVSEEEKAEVLKKQNKTNSPAAAFIKMRLCSGSVDNIKPALVMQAFYQYLGTDMQKEAMFIHRKELFARVEREKELVFVPLEELGEEINE